MQSRRLEIYVCIVLVVATLAVYGQVWNHGFIYYDDADYVTENPFVQRGLTLESVSWSFTATEAANWHPLTWLSHMMDCQLFGLNPGPHHLTSLLFHIANTLLLFIVFRMMTGALWQSAFVAVLFALHPLHVESVAWVAERKDVLSAFFWLLTMWGYVRYARNPGIVRYLMVLVFFTMGLMSKPMVVTLPFVLLLMDYWPLGRFRWEEGVLKGLRLVWEKVPLFLLSAASGVVTFLVQKGGGAVSSLEVVPLKIRAANALVSYVSYLGEMVWPHELAIMYPYPGVISPWLVAGAAILLLVISFLVIRVAKRHPYLFIGWLWYLGTLVPVIGLVQVGSQSMADRYTYLPMIGIGIMCAWGIPGIAVRWSRYRGALAAGVVSIVAVLMVVTWVQVRYWQNNNSLFQHALDVTTDNYLAHTLLGLTLARQGERAQAMEHYREALRIAPRYLSAHMNLGKVLEDEGSLEEAMAHYSQVLQIRPDDAGGHYNVGNVLAKQGKTQSAMEHYREALRINPRHVKAHTNLGYLLAGQGDTRQAVEHYRQALRINPGFETAHYHLAAALAQGGKLDEAVRHYSEAVKIKPDYAEAHFHLGTALMRRGDYEESVRSYSEAMRLNPDMTSSSLYNIACVYALQNRTAESIDALRKAVTRGFDNWDLIRTDTDLENIRGSAAYRELLEGR